MLAATMTAETVTPMMLTAVSPLPSRFSGQCAALPQPSDWYTSSSAVRYVFVVITHDAPDSFGRCGLMVTYAMYQAKLEERYSLALPKQLRDAVQQTAILLSEGKSVTISATEQELTTEQAAHTGSIATDASQNVR